MQVEPTPSGLLVIYRGELYDILRTNNRLVSLIDGERCQKMYFFNDSYSVVTRSSRSNNLCVYFVHEKYSPQLTLYFPGLRDEKILSVMGHTVDGSRVTDSDAFVLYSDGIVQYVRTHNSHMITDFVQSKHIEINGREIQSCHLIADTQQYEIKFVGNNPLVKILNSNKYYENLNDEEKRLLEYSTSYNMNAKLNELNILSHFDDNLTVSIRKGSHSTVYVIEKVVKYSNLVKRVTPIYEIFCFAVINVDNILILHKIYLHKNNGESFKVEKIIDDFDTKDIIFSEVKIWS